MMDLIPVIGFVRTWWKVALILVAAASLSFILGRCEGQRIERNAWQLQTERLKLAAEKLQRAADQHRAAREAVDQARIASNREEVDNAVRDIPDQATSARQRERACLELRRQRATPAAIDAAGCAAAPR